MNGDAALKISIFLVIVAVTLYVVYRVSSRNTTTADYYATGGAFTGVQNRWRSASANLPTILDHQGHGLPPVPAEQPGPDVDPAVVPARPPRHGGKPRPRRHRAVRRAGGPLGDGIGAGAS
jgi:hypothetical protein